MGCSHYTSHLNVMIMHLFTLRTFLYIVIEPWRDPYCMFVLHSDTNHGLV
jgi:hypothetical protein